MRIELALMQKLPCQVPFRAYQVLSFNDCIIRFSTRYILANRFLSKSSHHMTSKNFPMNVKLNSARLVTSGSLVFLATLDISLGGRVDPSGLQLVRL